MELDVTKVTKVLLPDGWHQVMWLSEGPSQSTFELENVQKDVCNGFAFRDIDTNDFIMGPHVSIRALQFAGD